VKKMKMRRTADRLLLHHQSVISLGSGLVFFFIRPFCRLALPSSQGRGQRVSGSLSGPSDEKIGVFGADMQERDSFTVPKHGLIPIAVGRVFSGGKAQRGRSAGLSFRTPPDHLAHSRRSFTAMSEDRGALGDLAASFEEGLDHVEHKLTKISLAVFEVLTFSNNEIFHCGSLSLG
jgi:hypothetical protein